MVYVIWINANGTADVYEPVSEGGNMITSFTSSDDAEEWLDGYMDEDDDYTFQYED